MEPSIDIPVPIQQPPRKLSRAQRAALSDERLIRAALELIAESGIESVTLRGIGERAGYSRGLVNYRFGTKEALLRSAAGHLLRRWSDEVMLPAVGDKIGLAALREMVSEYLKVLRSPEPFAKAYHTLVYAALGPIPQLRAELMLLHQELRERIAEWIRKGIERGEIRSDVDPLDEAAIFHGAMRGIGHQWMLDPESVDLERAYAALIDNLERSLHA
jgi:AcrR family transcriptional regulator